MGPQGEPRPPSGMTRNQKIAALNLGPWVGDLGHDGKLRGTYLYTGMKEEPRASGRAKEMSRKDPGTFGMWENIPVPALEPQYKVDASQTPFQKGVARWYSSKCLPSVLRPWVSSVSRLSFQHLEGWKVEAGAI